MANKRSRGQVRIIAGDWRGRKLPVGNAAGLRPTTDRVRETVFNWLTPYVGHARVLDLFSGSGALAFEALSRGARYALMYESNRDCADTIARNIDVLGARADVVCADVRAALRQPPDAGTFDIVMIDPPFADEGYADVIGNLSANHWLSADALLYIERRSGAELPSELFPVREKSAGGVQFGLYRVQEEGSV